LSTWPDHLFGNCREHTLILEDDESETSWVSLAPLGTVNESDFPSSCHWVTIGEDGRVDSQIMFCTTRLGQYPVRRLACGYERYKRRYIDLECCLAVMRYVSRHDIHSSDAHEWASRARGESRVVEQCGPLASGGEWGRVV
jgi:hypothetical protein